MSASIRTTREAEQQISLATEWWRANRRESAELLEVELAEAFSLLSKMPNIGKPYRGNKISNLHRLLLRRTRYHVYYVYNGALDEIIILTLWSAVQGNPPTLLR